MGITIVLVTHEMELIKQLCDKMAIIENQEKKQLRNTLKTFL